MQELLRQALLASATVRALVDDRVSWARLPDRKRLPAIILHLITAAPRDYSSAGRTPVTAYVVQVDCWAGSSAAAAQLKAAAIAVLDGLRSKPLQVFIERDHAAWEAAPGPGADRTSDLHRASTDVRCWHHETA